MRMPSFAPVCDFERRDPAFHVQLLEPFLAFPPTERFPDFMNPRAGIGDIRHGESDKKRAIHSLYSSREFSDSFRTDHAGTHRTPAPFAVFFRDEVVVAFYAMYEDLFAAAT